MKAEVEKKEPVFQPMTMSLTFESAEELEAFYTVFNMSYVCDWAEKYGIKTADIRYELSRNGEVRYNTKHREFLKHLQDVV